MTGPVFQRNELVKVVQAEYAGHWGKVVEVVDHSTDGIETLVYVQLLTARRKTIVPDPPAPVPFDPSELAPLFDATGTWVRSGRVVSRKNWPRQRLEATL